MPTTRLLALHARTAGRDRGALARLIAEQEPDLVCLHGAPHRLRWRTISAAIARRSGLVVVAGGGTDTGANLLLCRLGVDAGPARPLVFRTGAGRPRPGAQLAVVSVRGTELALVSATVAGNAAVRVAQVRELLDSLADLAPGAPPAIIAAEGSDRVGTAAWQALADDRTAVPGGVYVADALTVRDARRLPGGVAGRAEWAPTVVDLEL